MLLALTGQHRIRHAFLAPALINMLLQHPSMETADLSTLEHVYYGASPISEEVLKRAQDRFGSEFSQLYGLTETIGGGAYLPPSAHDPKLGKLRACGKPSPGYEVRIRLDGRDAQTGEVGEIEIRSPGIMKGYWNRPDATAQAIDAQGWFRSGDAGFFDADGYLFIHDRVKDMIVTGGENVYPAEVENALFAHPDVADAAVVGVPDDRWGGGEGHGGAAARRRRKPRRHHRPLPAADRRLQGPQERRLHRRPAPKPLRQGAAPRTARPLLGRPRPPGRLTQGKRPMDPHIKAMLDAADAAAAGQTPPPLDAIPPEMIRAGYRMQRQAQNLNAPKDVTATDIKVDGAEGRSRPGSTCRPMPRP
uniref:AMP-binding protein n=1 Tax=Phenylobacterium glaciei TaxID=2803784 RepID=A0A974S9N8_9CAUL|nr:AMP-binding protein [Phenylobacterium glaciei]